MTPPRSRRGVRLALCIVAACLVLLAVSLLTACTAPAAPVQGAELVRVVVQTERTAQIRPAGDRIEVVAAAGWPQLHTPTDVCVRFDGDPHPIKARAARLLERSACGGQP